MAASAAACGRGALQAWEAAPEAACETTAMGTSAPSETNTIMIIVTFDPSTRISLLLLLMESSQQGRRAADENKERAPQRNHRHPSRCVSDQPTATGEVAATPDSAV